MKKSDSRNEFDLFHSSRERRKRSSIEQTLTLPTCSFTTFSPSVLSPITDISPEMVSLLSLKLPMQFKKLTRWASILALDFLCSVYWQVEILSLESTLWEVKIPEFRIPLALLGELIDTVYSRLTVQSVEVMLHLATVSSCIIKTGELSLERPESFTLTHVSR